MTETLNYQLHDDGVGVITFNRPGAHNALDLMTMRIFRDLVHALGDDEALRVLILTGSGDRAFCSGADLNELANYPTADDAQAMITLMGDALLALEQLPVPVIAAINGYALGGGSEIALACDIRIVDEAVRMGMVQIRMGVTPGWGAGQRLMRIVGYSRAMHILLTGSSMRAAELQTLGIATEITEPGAALKRALGFARRIAHEPPGVVRGIKALLQAGLNQPYEEALQTERAIFPPLWADEPHALAVEDFLKRQARKNGNR